MRHGAGLFKIGPASRLRNVSADNSRLICMYVISPQVVPQYVVPPQVASPQVVPPQVVLP